MRVAGSPSWGAMDKKLARAGGWHGSRVPRRRQSRARQLDGRGQRRSWGGHLVATTAGAARSVTGFSCGSLYEEVGSAAKEGVTA